MADRSDVSTGKGITLLKRFSLDNVGNIVGNNGA